jgi:hypothetical protein
MKTKEALLEENRIIHLLIAEINDATEEAAEEWKNWAALVDQQRLSIILREMYTGILVATKKCTEFESKNYINQQIKEKQKMNTSDIKAGSKQRIKIGKNEVEVTVLGQKGKSWLVESATGKKFPVTESRFLRDEKVETKPAVVKKTKTPKPETSSPKPKLSMLDAAAKILKDASHPMSSKELITAMEEANLWASPSGKTPWNTLSAAIGREASQKENPRFKKAEKGKFALASCDIEEPPKCPDCGVALGEAHKKGCDVTRYSASNGPRRKEDKSKVSIWTGEWPD